MQEMVCLPFFHPTQIVLVDDDASFLKYFPRSLGPEMPVVTYVSPRDFLADLTNKRFETHINLKCWTSYTGHLTDERQEHMVVLDKTMLFMRVFSRRRFAVLSVALIDYAMPEMDGLDLCHALSHLPCRKILLTGHATDAQAVAAFNDGLIDAFVPKSDPNLSAVVRERIRRFQRAFIADESRLIRLALRTENANNWEDPSFGFLLRSLCETHGFVEYYAISDPAEGFLLVDAEGNGRLLLTYGAPALEAGKIAARYARAPADVQECLDRRQLATYFSQEDGTAILDATAWREACVPLRPFPSDPDRYYSLVSHCRPLEVSPQTVLGLRAYLAGAS